MSGFIGVFEGMFSKVFFDLWSLFNLKSGEFKFI